jgi:hypothetical protein
MAEPATDEEIAKYKDEIASYAELDPEIRFNVKCGFLARLIARVEAEQLRQGSDAMRRPAAILSRPL